MIVRILEWWCLFAGICVAGIGSSPPGGMPDEDSDENGSVVGVHSEAIDNVFDDWSGDDRPGGAVAVVVDGEVVHARGYGMANLEHRVPNSPRTRFRIASTSKQFTAAAVALLAHDGALSLDDEISVHLPWIPRYESPITIRHLVHHTSGIRDYLLLAFLAGHGDASRYDVDEVRAMLGRQRRVNFSPGAEHLYSNSGYLLLAAIVETVSGKTLDQYCRDRMFEPLAMHASLFLDDHTRLVPDRADGYRPADDGFRIHNTTLDMVGDGGLFTTVEDLVRWNANFDENRLGGGRALIDTLLTPGRLDDGTELDYAFGLIHSEVAGRPAVEHGGAFVGFRAQFLRLPEDRITVVVLANRSDADVETRARAVAEHILDSRAIRDATDSESATPPGSPTDDSRSADAVGKEDTPPGAAKLEGAIANVDLAAFGGLFRSKDRGLVREIRLVDGALRVTSGLSDEGLPLDVVGERTLAIRELPVRLEFDELDRGRDRRVRVFVQGELDAELVAIHGTTLGPEDLDRYTGTYHSPELDHRWRLERVENEAKRASLRITGPGEPLIAHPFTHDLFGTEDGFLIDFELDEDGRATGFSLQAGRVRDLHFAKRNRP